MKNDRRSVTGRFTGVFSASCMVGLMAVVVMGASACNTNTVEYLTTRGTINKAVVTPIGGQVPMDILWVIDNSFSMCEEQKILRDNFNEFITEINRTNLDFHIAVTTTHAPESGVTIEPIAQEALLQSTPQPVPGNNQECLRGAGKVDGQDTAFVPLRESLQVAKDCLADPSQASAYTWSDAQIECALRSAMSQQQTGCVASSGLPDRNGDTSYDIFDIFPDKSSYRPIPKVLRAVDYLDANKNVDTEKLRKDFSCMSTVGTRGDGYEKGLRAAMEAVSPEKTGGFFGAATADTSAPNYGFVRQEAGFALIFVTDENDCSHDGTMMELGNACGADVCEYYNSSALAPEDTPLISPATLADQLKANLAATKGLQASQLNEENVLVASINGTSRRYTEPFPVCGGTDQPEITPVCSDPTTGDAYSGDRYERFLREFPNHYPDTRRPEDKDNKEILEPVGFLCAGTFAAALGLIAEFISKDKGACIAEDVLPCESDAECPEKLYAGVPGACLDFPGATDGRKYCDSGILLKLERNPEIQNAVTPEIDNLEYCLPDSLGNKLGTKNPSCVIDPKWYTLQPCSSGLGVQYQWVEPVETVTNKLSGYTLETVYNFAPR